jgi:hypothetical protein
LASNSPTASWLGTAIEARDFAHGRETISY